MVSPDLLQEYPTRYYDINSSWATTNSGSENGWTNVLPNIAAARWPTVSSPAPLSGVEWSGVEWSGFEWSGVEWSGVSPFCNHVDVPCSVNTYIRLC